MSFRLDDWGNSFNANVTVTNGSREVIDGWALEFDFVGTQTINSAWNAVVTQSGRSVTASSPSWNQTIPAGGSVSFGMNGASSGTNGVPAAFSLNDADCTVR